jgi:hypothetical protein
MNDQIYNKVITITGVEQKNGKMTLTDHEGKKFSFWMTKKDGTNSSPYAQFKDADLKQGSTIQIGYVLEEYESAYGPKKSNKIISFRETNEAPSKTSAASSTQNSIQPERYVPEPSTASQGISRDEFSRRLGIQGHINALLSNPSFTEPRDDFPASINIPHIITLAIQIEDEAEKQLNPKVDSAKAAYERGLAKAKEKKAPITEDKVTEIFGTEDDDLASLVATAPVSDDDLVSSIPF